MTDAAAPATSQTTPATASSPAARTPEAPDWRRTAVIYQVYPRSFADSTGSGVGDIPGITARLDALADLGVDAVWLSPFYRSPQKDAGYDVSDFRDIDPSFGTLADFDAMLDKAHGLGLRIIVDMVPNHTSDQHPWFQAALAAAPGSPERARYLFRDGRGEHGELPPNNWPSVFGGPAWTRVTEADGSPGQWYLHLFDSSQPDLDWTQEEVRAEFDDVLRFWLDRGVDGFRVDVAHGLAKAPGLPDLDHDPTADAPTVQSACWGQDGVHEVWRRWRRITDEYDGDRALVAEAWIYPLDFMARWVRPDEMHQAFNFPYMETGWSPAQMRSVIDESLAAFGAVGAPSTWVLSNHDIVRHTTRLAQGVDYPQGHGVGPETPGLPDVESGIRRGRAATLFMLGLPGSAYLYQGEELGLPEAVDLPPEARQDPTFARTGGARYGRDGCRVPLPWEADSPAFGFSPTGESWLPQPADWRTRARDAQRGRPGSTLEMYRTALRERRANGLATGSIAWLEVPEGALAYVNGDVAVVTNMFAAPFAVPGEVLASSAPFGGTLAPDTTVWVRRDDAMAG
ncbi:glycoside hydrolase family 13 protein [Lysinimicrobium pelophilum]|uniref:glycoside hydrolase family 13 protein n=1 Tax=Demequina pelophila TaxID=1638984 RepID=UPI000784F58B